MRRDVLCLFVAAAAGLLFPRRVSAEDGAETARKALPQAVRAAAALRPAPQDGPFTWDSGPYSYDSAGNIAHIGTQYFQYDGDSRLTFAHVISGAAWTEQSFEYDPYGNMTKRWLYQDATPIAVDGSTNHLSGGGATYDAAGDLLTWQPPGSSSTYDFRYDAFGMLTEQRLLNESVPRAYYVYTADDERLRTTSSAGSGVTDWKVRGLDGKVLRDFQRSGSSTWTAAREYVYRGGLLLTSKRGDGTTEHFSLDHLGTPRLITNDAHEKTGLHTYLPFGEEMGANAQEGESLKFTGHERDDPMGGVLALDYMHARYYASMPGRFLSVDPVVDIKAAAAQPQLWNAYAYVHNRALIATDPNGREEALVYGQTKNVHPGDVLLLVSREGHKAKHIVIVAGFVKNKKGGLDAVVYENAPRSAQGRTTLKDNVSGPLTKVNSNDPSAGGAGLWNSTNVMVGAIFHNEHWGLFSFRESQIDRAAAAVGPLTYWNHAPGSLDPVCDCAGGVNQMLNILGGNQRGVGLLGPRTLESWESKARLGFIDLWD